MLKPSLPLQIFNPKPTDLTKTPIQSITAMAKPLLGRPVMLLLLSVSAGLASMQPCAATPFQWEYTRSLKTERSDHTATLLPDGRVLVASGQHLPGILRSAELYNPSTAHWNRTGKLYNPRYDHTATLLSNGTVLVAGGAQLSFGNVACEFYDPASGTWTGTGNLNIGRFEHTATLLADGKVLLAGGFGTSGGDRLATRNCTIRPPELGP